MPWRIYAAVFVVAVVAWITSKLIPGTELLIGIVGAVGGVIYALYHFRKD